MSTATLKSRPKTHSLPSNAELQRRIKEVRNLKIDFIPNESFDELLRSEAGDELANVCLPTSAEAAPADLPEHLRRLCETDLLTPEAEQTLFRQMNYFKFRAHALVATLDDETSDLHVVEQIESLLRAAQAIRDHIIQANLRLVMSVVKKFVTPYQSFDEMLSEGTVTLMQAVEKFDFDRGFRFSTYAYRSISRTAYRCVAAAREEEARMTRDADDWAFQQSDEQPSSSMSDHLWNGLRDLTASMLHRLDRRERFIIRCRYALGSHRRVRTFQDLANRLGVSKERVRQLEARAVAKLQQMANDVDIDEIRLTAS